MNYRIMTRRTLGAFTLLTFILGTAYVVTNMRDRLRSLPFLNQLNYPWTRQVEVWLYHLRYSPLDQSELGDGKSAREILLHGPAGLAADERGNIYLSDRGLLCCGRVIWQLDRHGRATIIAGTGHRGISRTDIDARDSSLGSPQGIALDRSGRVYFADSYNHLILRVEQSGLLTRVAGTGRPGFSGDGGDALMAALDQPYDVSLDGEGNVYIADFGNHRIRKVTREGNIVTFAGIGEPSYTGDGGAASLAGLNGPYVVLAVGTEVVIADSLNHVIRRVDRGGIITTIAGNGREGYAGDGGSPTLSTLNAPQALFVDKAGRLLVVDEHNHVVRVVEGDRILTLIGTGAPGYSEDGIQYREAALNDPEEIVVLTDGSILVVDGLNKRVRQLGQDGLLTTFAGSPALPTEK